MSALAALAVLDLALASSCITQLPAPRCHYEHHDAPPPVPWSEALRYSYGVAHRWFPLRLAEQGWWPSTTRYDDALADLHVKAQPCERCRAGSIARARALPAHVPRGHQLELIARSDSRGTELVVRNAAGQPLALRARDSWLMLRQQARGADGRFVDIQMIYAWCGNVARLEQVLPPRTQWRFTARRYAGPILTELRFCMPAVAPRGARICSNTFIGGVHSWQLELMSELALRLGSYRRDLSDKLVGQWRSL